MTTKIDIINGAYSQMRISGLTVSATPEDVSVALSRLEDMMSELEYSRNICMGYNFEVEPDPDSVTNVIQPYWHMMKTNLAIRLIPDFNKEVPMTLMNQASQSLSTASARSAADNIQEVIYPVRMPRGSGNTIKYNQRRRFQRQQKPAPNECATKRLLLGEIDDYTESFRAYLKDGESISSFSVTSDPGLTVVSSANNDPVINYTLRADNNSQNGTWQQVKIEVTTSDGRKEIRIINVDIQSSDIAGS